MPIAQEARREKQSKIKRLSRWFLRIGIYALCGFVLGVGTVRTVRIVAGQRSAQYVAASECGSIYRKVMAKFAPSEPPDDAAHETEHRSWWERAKAELKQELDPIVQQLPAPKAESTANDVFEVVRVDSPSEIEDGAYLIIPITIRPKQALSNGDEIPFDVTDGTGAVLKGGSIELFRLPRTLLPNRTYVVDAVVGWFVEHPKQCVFDKLILHSPEKR